VYFCFRSSTRNYSVLNFEFGEIKKIIENLSKDFGAFRPKKLFWSCKGKMFRELDDTPAKFMVLDHTISKFRGPDFMSACHIITREEKMVLESGFGT